MKRKFAITALLCIFFCSNTLAVEKREVSFKNGDVTLVATLYLPKGNGPFPTVIFVHGSGPETRDNSRYSSKWLASIGYVALAFDKRGAGESGGNKEDWNRFNFATLASDVIAAVDFLKTKNYVNPDKIGLHASSQGGWVAPLVASKTNQISFMIIKSASVCSVGEDRVFERSERLKKEGFVESEIAEAQEMQRVEAKTIPEENAPDEFTRLFKMNLQKKWFPRVYGGTDPFTKSLTTFRSWYASIVDFNSVPFLEDLDIPIFWIFGNPDLDHSGPVSLSISNLERLVQVGKPYEIVQFDDQGHNINERKYELALYKWLNQINAYKGYKFKKH